MNLNIPANPSASPVATNMKAREASPRVTPFQCGMGGVAPRNFVWWPEEQQIRRVGVSSRDLGVDVWN